MSALTPLLLGLGMLLPAVDPSPPVTDPAQLRELLQDRQHPRSQSQAALLLVQASGKEAEEIVRQGLKQTDAAEPFLALAGALRLCRDGRFVPELLQALSNDKPAVREAAAETLAVLADDKTITRLQNVVEDGTAEPAARLTALAVLGRSGRKAAAIVLLDQLSHDNENLRQAAADALTILTGQAYGIDIPRWRAWWEKHKDLSRERWLEERLAYQASRTQRLEGDLERAKVQLVRLNQQLYARLPAADRLGHVQALVDQEDSVLRTLAIAWSVELLPAADAVGQRALADGLLRLSRDGSSEVQRAAVLALGRVDDPRAFDRLKVLLRRGGTPVRAAAARALAQQVRGGGAEVQERQRQVVPTLQKALDDPALEVVVEAAEALGTLGVPEAGPVLTVLLKHPSEPVRQTAAQALERVSDPCVLDGLLAALDDAAAPVRFSLVGALGHAAGDGKALPAGQRERLLARLDGLLRRDTDPGVRSRAATVLGECGSPKELPLLWACVLDGEEGRVQEKAWAAFIEVVARAESVELLAKWNGTLAEAKKADRRLQLLSEVSARWQKKEEAKSAGGSALELLVQAQLDESKWALALPGVRELLSRPGGDTEVQKRLRWLLTAGELALKEGNRQEAQRVVQDAQPYLPRGGSLAAEFEKLAKQAQPP